jgi:ADP-ribose pyrophosphatase
MRTDAGVVLIRQYRSAVGSDLWEIPAGTLDTGESPAECAARELEEETGYRAESLAPLAEFYTSPGFCDEIIYMYLAAGCTATGSQSLDDDEHIVESRTFPIDEALEMVSSGEIRDGKTIVGLNLAAQALA